MTHPVEAPAFVAEGSFVKGPAVPDAHCWLSVPMPTSRHAKILASFLNSMFAEQYRRGQAGDPPLRREIGASAAPTSAAAPDRGPANSTNLPEITNF